MDRETRRREALLRFIESRGLNVNRVAKEAGFAEGGLRDFLAGRNKSVNLATYEKIADQYDVSLAELLGEPPPRVSGFDPSKLVPGETRVPVTPITNVLFKGAVQAGVWKDALEWNQEKWYEAPVMVEEAFRGLELFGLEVAGNSMNELYPPGSRVICVQYIHLGRNPRPGERVVCQRRSEMGYEATIKELRLDADGQWWLWPRSTDPNFQQPWKLPALDTENDFDNEDITIVGLVIMGIRPEPIGQG